MGTTWGVRIWGSCYGECAYWVEPENWLGLELVCRGAEMGEGTFVKNPLEVSAVFELLRGWFILADVFEDYFSEFLPDPGVFGQRPKRP